MAEILDHDDGRILASKSGSKLSLPRFQDIKGAELLGIDNNTGLEIKIYKDKKRDLVVADAFPVVGRNIVSNNDNGFDIILPAEVNNALVLKNNQCNSIFFVEFKIFDTQTKEQKGGVITYNCGVEGDLTEIVERNSTPNKVNFDINSKKESVSPVAADIPSVEKESESVQTAAPVEDNAPVKKKSLLLLILGIIGGLLLLALIIAAVMYFTGMFNKDDNAKDASNEPVQEEQVANEPEKESEDESSDPVKAPADNSANTNVSASSSVNVCSVSDKADAQILSACLGSKPGNAVIVNLAKEAVEKNRCDLAKRIYSSLGRKDAAVSLELAKYYDSNSANSSACFEKSKEQATYWYQKAVDLGDESAKSALEKLQ